jgi:hypothetical protein
MADVHAIPETLLVAIARSSETYERMACDPDLIEGRRL